MARKPPPRNNFKPKASKKAAPARPMPMRKAAGPKRKPKLPVLGGGLGGLGGTGAQGMMP